MGSHVDRDKLRVTEGGPKPSPETRVETVDDVVVIVTQAFCPNGHDLVKDTTVLFDGNPGISLKVTDGTTEGVVVLSPVHGDRRKQGASFPDGARLSVTCPQCGVALPVLCPCTCGSGDLVKLYLTPSAFDGHIAAVCNVWGCQRSRLIDNWQIISQFVEGDEQ